MTTPTQFEIEHLPEQYADRVQVTVNDKFHVAIIRTPEGIVLDVYPKGWDYPIETMTVWDDDVATAEAESTELIAVDDVCESGRKFLRLEQGGKQWEEPIEDWELVIDLIEGTTCYNSKDGRCANRPKAHYTAIASTGTEDA